MNLFSLNGSLLLFLRMNYGSNVPSNKQTKKNNNNNNAESYLTKGKKK